MSRRIVLAAVLALAAAACGRAPTAPADARTPAGPVLDGDSVPADSTIVQSDTTGRGGGTLGSGT